ncbi:MAG: lysylphosphatidylglycerol synthase transmembrane domain-containing protein [Acidobacteriota bacterium]
MLRFAGRTLLKAILTALLLAWLVSQIDLGRLAAAIGSTHLSFLLAAVLVQLFSILLSVVRWRTILASFRIHISLKALAKITFIGSFFSLVLPSGIGGDFFRAYYLAKREKRGMSTTLTTTVLERSGGLCALLAIGVVAAAVSQIEVRGARLVGVFLALFAFYLAAVLALFNRRVHAVVTWFLQKLRLPDIESRMELVYQGLRKLRGNLGAVAVVLLLSLIVQFSSVVIVWIVALGLEVQAPFPVFLVFIPLINLSILVPLTINGFGLRESLYLLLFTQVGMGQERAVALSLLSTLAIAVAALPGGLIYSLYKKEEQFDQILHRVEEG